MASRILSRSFKSLNSVMSLVKQVKPTQSVLRTVLAQTRPISVSTQLRSSSEVSKKLTTFISEEIKLETDSRKSKPAQAKLTGFDVKTEGPIVTATKTHGDENITIVFNVNGSLDDDQPFDQTAAEKNENQPEPELKSRPTFSIDIKKGSQVLSFGCSFLPSEESDKAEAEDFQIDEFAVHNGTWDEKVYTADCTVLDENLYDMLLNYLDERGIGVKLANELADFSTSYEHQQYIDLLQKLENFLKK